ncbi:glycerophosphodiester phosphodiesterase [Legionella maceachernii]|uniref:Glycerophosphoryl diester esterase n=1 Tax=Legionella maceachernii TaxID=466 RepID=A0A0W0VZY0_9GAMM|nr:glycerophosphodiester phosphodiesterase [Legionella maceachernii]KTD25744.1 glycerophosphoryl diester esterase [Legionella maceachernii]SJZ92430.1 glycerophosphoryl diester phosphodiesterase [Legionella maceachernii]SUP03542.1 Glycerophosphoryl diester phosphodiesterase [Legionella maceachernii]
MQTLERIIGHRGASAYAPENTIAAFDRAFAMGCRYLEFDVMLSADGEPFVFHDESLKRTTNGKGEIGLVTAEYLQSLDAGKWFSRRFLGEKIPHLRDVLQWLTFSDVKANIEIKPYPGTSEQTTVAVLSHINRYWPQSKPLPLVSSFDLAALTLCHSLSPEMPLGLLLDEWDKDWLVKAKELQCYSVHFNKRALTAARVQQIKEQGYVLCVYTVNRKRQAKKLFDWGVDAVFSDYPDLLS